MFVKSADGTVILWNGAPSDQDAHEWILDWLKELEVLFAQQAVSDRVKGNLGESICFAIGYKLEFSGLWSDASNALTPFNEVSRPDIDIVWIKFGPSPMQDHAILQEVKTTSSTDLTIADRLPHDYAKLFGTNPELTLHTRLQAIANKIHYQQGKPKALANRLRELAGTHPQTTTRVKLLPTLVFDSQRAPRPQSKMAAVRQIVAAQGWDPLNVATWAVGIANLDDRFARLRAGRA